MNVDSQKTKNQNMVWTMILENERKDLSEALHNEIGGFLTAIKLQASKIKTGADNNDIKPTIDNIINYVAKMQSYISNTTETLYSLTYIHHGLKAGVEELAEDAAEILGANLHLSIEISEEELGQEIKTTIYRITQELLNNTVKHSKSSEISVSIYECDNDVVLSVSDNGIGIKNEHNHLKKEHRGLWLINERVKLHNGRVVIKPLESAGTIINIIIPNE